MTPITLISSALPEQRALVLTRVPSPWWAPSFVLRRKFIEAVPEYAAIPHLEHKVFTVAEEDRRFGGVYEWANRAAAEAFFDERWHERVRRRRGVDGEVLIFDVLGTVEGLLPAGTRVEPHGLIAPMAISWTRGAESFDERPVGLSRTTLVRDERGQESVFTLWSSRAAGDASWAGRRPDARWFTAPVRVDAKAAQAEAPAARVA